MIREIVLKTLALLILSFATVSVSAQKDSRSKVVLDKSVAKIKSYPAVEVIFDLTMENLEENIRDTHAGKAHIKDQMYKIEIMGIVNYFDGETIYEYNPDVEEVNVKFPEENQEELMNPTILFDIHNQKFNQQLIEEKEGKAYIELTPKTPHKQITKIGVWINTSNDAVEKVTTFGKDGNNVIITIKSLKKPAEELDVAFFQFDTKANPNVEVVDLR